MSKEFVYIDSSQDEQKQIKEKYQPKNQQINYLEQMQRVEGSPSHRFCLAHNPQVHLLKQSQYDELVTKLLREKIDKQTKKKLITNIQDTQVVQNINKRNAHYSFFLEKMKIDQKYRAIQQEKADRLKAENERKKKILYKVQSQNQMKKQEAQLKNYIVYKQQKQEKVVNSIKRQVKKLGFQRIYNAHKKMKEQIKQMQAKKEMEIASKIVEQRNKILELQQEFQAIKEEKRINKLAQRDVLNQFKKQLEKQKQTVQQKLHKKMFQV